jgi:chemotaxis protein methyltransferase WspC
MCLADLNVPVEAAHIDAIDISSRNIDRARRACFGNNSFRNTDTAFRDRYFIRENQCYRLADTIRARVNFSRANVLEAEFVRHRQPYQVIFCRNLLIYFDRPTQNLTLDRLDQLLSPDGLLFLGHSETSLLLERRFSPLEFPFSFGFRRSRTRRDATIPDRPGRPTSAAPAPVTRTTDLHIGNGRGAHHPPQPVPVDNGLLLSKAFRLADQGHLDEAAKHCETLLRRDCNQADVHFLLGIIRESAGNIPDAEQMLRKAIYLDPDHHEALTLLSVICLRNGDEDAAHRFQQRAARARHRYSDHGVGK